MNKYNCYIRSPIKLIPVGHQKSRDSFKDQENGSKSHILDHPPPLNKLSYKLLARFPKTRYNVNLLTADIIYEVIEKNTPKELEKSPLSYLEGIGKNLLKQESKKMAREILMENNSLDNFAFDSGPDEDKSNVMMDRLTICFSKLPDSCRNLFICLSEMDNITEAVDYLGYHNSETLSSRKCQCLIGLKKIISQDDPWLAKMLEKKKNKDNERRNRNR